MTEKNRISLKKLTMTAMIAAAYTVIGMVLLPMTFGPIQVRVSEALTLLAVTGPVGIYGVTLGCFLTNLIGVFTGANILGLWDILFGTAATFSAALGTYLLRNVRWRGFAFAAALPPVIINALVIGAELWIVFHGGQSLMLFLLNAGQVGLGQLVSCCLLGVPLLSLLEKKHLLKSLS